MKDFKDIYVSNLCFKNCRFINIKLGHVFCKRYSLPLAIGDNKEVNDTCLGYITLN